LHEATLAPRKQTDKKKIVVEILVKKVFFVCGLEDLFPGADRQTEAGSVKGKVSAFLARNPKPRC